MTLAISLLAVALSGAAAPSSAPAVPPSAEVLALEAAVLDLARERDELKAALAAATAEVARLRQVQDETSDGWQSCETDLARSLELGEALMNSHRAMSDLLSQERKAAKRQRFMDWLRIGLPSMAGGYILGEVNGD